MLHPTTPQALPRARTASGKISAGYTQGTVSHVAPNVEVKMKIIEAAAAPYDEAWLMLPSALELMARRENPPARNMAMPCTIEPQYNVQRRPMRSKVNTQTRVANLDRY